MDKDCRKLIHNGDIIVFDAGGATRAIFDVDGQMCIVGAMTLVNLQGNYNTDLKSKYNSIVTIIRPRDLQLATVPTTYLNKILDEDLEKYKYDIIWERDRDLKNIGVTYNGIHYMMSIEIRHKIEELLTDEED